MTSERIVRVVESVARAARVTATSIHASLTLAIVEVLLKLLPLPRAATALGVELDLAPGAERQERLVLSELPPRARRQVRCAHVITDVWPNSRGPCLRRALVIGHLLRDHGPRLRLGVARADAEVRAHAWVEIGGRPLEDVADYHAFRTPPAATA